ncbi:hypothetical protein SO694_00122047 [Aureococcus anophagefferens]|uniref:Uncharacterized protein n=1 Tax=Aureococcus anophagefferens TaxID=44056 RepID=A0ABR1G352_AURAN
MSACDACAALRADDAAVRPQLLPRLRPRRHHGGGRAPPACRSAVPARVAGDLRVNRLLERSSTRERRTRTPRAEPRRGARGRAPSAARWTVVADLLSPASLAVLALVDVLGAPVAVSFEGMTYCDDKRRPEWARPEAPGTGVPRLECRPREGAPVVVTEPASIIRALLELYGEGRVDVGPSPSKASAGLVDRVRGEQLFDTAWTMLVNPVSQHLFCAVWDGHCNAPGTRGLVDALEWVDRTVGPAVAAHAGPRRTVLEITVGAPLLLLRLVQDMVLDDALQVRPGLRAFVARVERSDVGQAVARRVGASRHLQAYRERVRRGIGMAVIMLSGQTPAFDERAASKLVRPTFPYHDNNLGSASDGAEFYRPTSDLGKEELFEDYLRRYDNDKSDY